MAGLAGLLSGCSQGPASRLARSFQLAFGGEKANNIDIAKFQAQPFASMVGRLGKSGNVVLVLGQIDHGGYYWYSADKAALVTRQGRLVKTSGFPDNLVQTMFPLPDPLPTLAFQPAGATVTSTRIIDIDKGNHYGMVVRSTYTDLGLADIELPTGPRRLRGWQEDARVEAMDWDFTNVFWIEPEGRRVWSSAQHYMPGIPPVEMSLLKPPA